VTCCNPCPPHNTQQTTNGLAKLFHIFQSRRVAPCKRLFYPVRLPLLYLYIHMRYHDIDLGYEYCSRKYCSCTFHFTKATIHMQHFTVSSFTITIPTKVQVYFYTHTQTHRNVFCAAVLVSVSCCPSHVKSVTPPQTCVACVSFVRALCVDVICNKESKGTRQVKVPDSSPISPSTE
jgi:hypothetical protein